MTMTVWYSTRWNDFTRKPIMGYEWVDEERARELYARHEFFDIVDAAVIDDGLPFPRWVISPSLGFRVQFFDRALSVTRVVDYDPVEGRLFRCRVIDYVYPDESQQWAESDATHCIDMRIKPDGSGEIATWGSGPEADTLAEFTGLDTTSLWLPTPKFGEWTALANRGPAAAELAKQVDAV